MISLLLVTIDRYSTTMSTLEQNLADIKEPYELLVCDNGSTDKRVIEYIESKNPKYFRKNKGNEGVGKALNQLYIRCMGTHIVNLANDILLPPGWWNACKTLLDTVPNPGVIGVDWQINDCPPLSYKTFQDVPKPIEAHWLTPKLNRVFGCWAYKRNWIEKIGYFHEGYHPYGLEDSDVNERLNRSGFNSCYVPRLKSNHLIQDVGQDTPYRKMKDEYMWKNMQIFGERLKAWDDGELSLIERLPNMRDPL